MTTLTILALVCFIRMEEAFVVQPNVRRWRSSLTRNLVWPTSATKTKQSEDRKRKQYQSTTRTVSNETTATTVATVRHRIRGPIRLSRLSQAAQTQKSMKEAAMIKQRTAQQDPTLLMANNNTGRMGTTLSSSSSNTNSTFAVDFGELQTRGRLSVDTLRALQEVCGVAQMTVVQSQTFDKIWEGWSLQVQSKTGTGKTLAFLVPLLEQLLQEQRQQQRQQRPEIQCLIVVPTRELAQQVGNTIKDLLTFHHHPTKQGGGGGGNSKSSSLFASSWIQVLYGGTNIVADVRALERYAPKILVSTPGRLAELLSPSSSFKIRGRLLKHSMSQCRKLVLDEADLLLDSFATEVATICKALPRKRQTLFFSATLLSSLSPQHAKKRRQYSQLLQHAKGEPLVGFDELDCVAVAANANAAALNNNKGRTSNGDESFSHVNLNVQEYYMALSSMESYLSTLVALLKQELEEQQEQQRQAKIVVFLPAARLASCVAQLVQLQFRQQHAKNKGGVVVHSIHSRMSMAQRRQASQGFSSSSSLSSSILISSDVSARGMDYPNVTTVIQYGLPNSRELYLHRLGRTARAGQYGKGVLVAMPFEQQQHGTAAGQKQQQQQQRRQQRTGRRGSKRTGKRFAWTNRMKPYELLQVVSPLPQPLLLQPGKEVDRVEAAYKAFCAYYIGQGYDTTGTVLPAAQEFAHSVGLAKNHLPELPEILRQS